MRDKTRIVVLFSQLTPLTPALSPRAGRGREIFCDVHPGRRCAGPGLLSDDPNGALYGRRPFILTPGSCFFWQPATKSIADHTGYQGQRPCPVGSFCNVLLCLLLGFSSRFLGVLRVLAVSLLTHGFKRHQFSYGSPLPTWVREANLWLNHAPAL